MEEAKCEEFCAFTMFLIYVTLSLIFDFVLVVYGALPTALYFSFVQVFQATIVLKMIWSGKEKDAAIAAHIFSLIHVAFAIFYLIAAAPYWLPAVTSAISSVASLLASAVATFAASAGMPVSSAALALSTAYLAAKLHRGDYRGASLALFFTFVFALALLLLTASPSA